MTVLCTAGVVPPDLYPRKRGLSDRSVMVVPEMGHEENCPVCRGVGVTLSARCASCDRFCRSGINALEMMRAGEGLSKAIGAPV